MFISFQSYDSFYIFALHGKDNYIVELNIFTGKPQEKCPQSELLWECNESICLSDARLYGNDITRYRTIIISICLICDATITTSNVIPSQVEGSLILSEWLVVPFDKGVSNLALALEHVQSCNGVSR